MSPTCNWYLVLGWNTGQHSDVESSGRHTIVTEQVKYWYDVGKDNKILSQTTSWQICWQHYVLSAISYFSPPPPPPNTLYRPQATDTPIAQNQAMKGNIFSLPTKQTPPTTLIYIFSEIFCFANVQQSAWTRLMLFPSSCYICSGGTVKQARTWRQQRSALAGLGDALAGVGNIQSCHPMLK